MKGKRCFGDDDPAMAQYHDTEWGVPERDSRKLFEHLILDIFQAGLSWRTILHKRASFREAFEGFDPALIAAYDADEVERLMANDRIVRNRKKIEATINNARCYLGLEETKDGFAGFLWSFTGGQTLRGPAVARFDQLPTTSAESKAMAAALREAGFQFIGPIICYAFMQAVGMVNDHLAGCCKHGGRA